MRYDVKTELNSCKEDLLPYTVMHDTLKKARAARQIFLDLGGTLPITQDSKALLKEVSLILFQKQESLGLDKGMEDQLGVKRILEFLTHNGHPLSCPLCGGYGVHHDSRRPQREQDIPLCTQDY